jgi:hypothetical protein
MCDGFSALTNECRRKSPQAFILNNNGKIQIIGGWPGTTKDNWCKDFIVEAPSINIVAN